MTVSRRDFLRLLGGGAAALGAGCISRPTRPAEVELSSDARALVRLAWAGLDPAQVVDVHAHIVGTGTGGTGCWVHEDSSSFTSPIRLFKTRVYKDAAGVWSDDEADALFVERLADLVLDQRPRGRTVLLAFDQHHDAQGRPVPELTEFYTPNDYIISLVKRWPQLFLFGCSVHPYRKDALEELTRCRAAGAVS